MVYGYWQSSGGRAPTSGGNRTLLFDSAGPGVSVTFTLTSAADAWLYLLDASGNVLAQDDNSGGGSNSRLTVALPPGTYKLVAATSAPNQSAEFTLELGQGVPALPAAARGQAGQPVRLDLRRLRHGRQLGCLHLAARPRPVPGLLFARRRGNAEARSASAMTFVVQGEGDLLARPVDYNWIWSDWGSGGTHDGSFWEPVAPRATPASARWRCWATASPPRTSSAA